MPYQLPSSSLFPELWAALLIAGIVLLALSQTLARRPVRRPSRLMVVLLAVLVGAMAVASSTGVEAFIRHVDDPGWWCQVFWIC